MDDRLSLNELKVLSALRTKEMYGLEIIKTIKEDENKSFKLGTLYNLLSRLEKRGYAESRWGDDTEERAGARRRYYKITGAGARVLAEQQQSLMNLWGLEGSLGMV